MAQLLEHQDSYVAYGKNFRGCHLGWLQFFRRRIPIRKIHSGRNLFDWKDPGENELLGSYVRLNSEEHDIMDDQILKKHNVPKGNSTKARIRALIFRRIGWKKGQNQKILPVARQLLRTDSMHYLDCNDYVLADDAIFDSDPSSDSFAKRKATLVQKENGSLKGHGIDQNLKQAREDVVNESRAAHRIAMDGILDRIPRGRIASEDTRIEKLKLVRFASARYDSDSSTSKFTKDPSIKRSRSLTESLSRYSHLLNSISTEESKRQTSGLKLSKDGYLNGLKAPTMFQRTNSTPEHRSYHLSEHAQTKVGHGISPMFPDLNLLGGFVDPSLDTVVDAKERPESDTTVSERINVCVGEQVISCELDGHTSRVLDPIESAASYFPFYDHRTEIMGKSVIDEDDGSKACEEEISVGVPVHEKEVGIEVASSELAKSSPISVLDPDFSDDPISPVRFTVLEDYDTKPASLHFHVSYEVESTEPPKSILHQIQANQKDEPEFIFVKDVFEKAGISTEERFETWKTLDQALLLEEKSEPDQLDMSRFNSDDASVDQQLLLDLMDEAILEIHEKYPAHKPWFSNFHFALGSKARDRRVSEDLWAKISWHLKSQMQSNCMLESVVLRDYAKDDGWSNHVKDTEQVAMEAESLIFDALIDEVADEVSELWVSEIWGQLASSSF